MKKYLIILTILTVIAGLIFGYFYAMIWAKNFRSYRGEVAGDKYISKVYTEYTVMGKNCQGEDTDDDGYISCGFRVKNAESIEKTVRLQCPTIWKSYTGSTCKESLSIPENIIQQI